ncbi:MFS transporter [Streptomyces cavernicola]|uniref:MFS transporter n=1 Tax=Streptomyces cavernicola TaxID=3043613 RepID=A0ABT6S5D4_9ACTN|nr:MFS transporter [Streptomyces sp. B-S-A6]MDI3403288.1 MFS transporter [Streptomyces sp. B-S-A6]
MSLAEKPGVQSAHSRSAYAKITLRIVPLIFLCYVAAYLDRINVGFAQLQMADELGFSNAVFGFGAGAFFIAYICFEIPSNLLLERVGARVWIARIMISWGVLSALTMFVTTPVQFYVVRFLLGVAEAGFVPGVLLYLTHWFPGPRRARVISLFMMGIPAAAMFGGPLSGWILSSLDQAAGWSGWQWLFLVEAVPTIVLGGLVLLLLPDRIATAGWLSTAEQESVRNDLDRDAEGADREHNIRGALRDARVWWLGVIDMSFMLGTYAIGFWLPTLVKEAGEKDTGTIGWLTAVPHAAALVAMLIAGASSDRFRERRWHLVVPMLVGAAGLAGSTLVSDDIGLTVLMFTVANVGIVACYPVFWCLPPAFLTGRAAAAGIALITSMANLGGFLATYLLGWLRDLTASPMHGLMLCAVFLLAGGALVLRLPASEVNR